MHTIVTTLHRNKQENKEKPTMNMRLRWSMIWNEDDKRLQYLCQHHGNDGSEQTWERVAS
jgi:hypothetical protein